MIRWVHFDKRRFYRASLQVDLFGDLYLQLAWGSLDSKRGSSMKVPCTTVAEARKELRDVFKTRRQHGYLLFP